MPSENGKSSSRLHFRAVVGKKVLIVGDVGTGKTRLTAALLDEAASSEWKDQITVVDMAPEIPAGHLQVGGRLTDYSQAAVLVRYLAPRHVHAPRLQGESKEQVLRLVKENAETIDRLLVQFLEAPTKVLFVNDVTLYLHSGNLSKIRQALDAAETCIVNGYRGTKLREDRGSGVSRREEEALSVLMKHVDQIVSL